MLRKSILAVLFLLPIPTFAQTDSAIGNLRHDGVDTNFKDKGSQVYNVMAYGASGSNQNTGAGPYATTTASSTTVTLPTALDFRNGQGVFIQDNASGKSVGPSAGPFCSTIQSGGGTTTLVLANAPSVSTSFGVVYHDDQVAEQAALNAADAAAPGGNVFWPPGTYNNFCVPLHDHGANNVRLMGAGRSSVTLQQGGNFPTGPAFVVTTATSSYIPASTYGAALLTGSGNSYNVTNGGLRGWLTFRQCLNQCGELNGLTSFTAEATIKLSTLTHNVSVLVSAGERDSGDGNKSAFVLGVLSTGALQCTLNTSVSGNKTITGAAGAVTTGSNFHVALSYDGSNLRCFLNGTQVTGSPTAQTGTVVQSDFEDVRTNQDASFFPDGGPLNWFPMDGSMDGIRLSGATSGAAGARYTANFTAPTAKWGAPDANTWIHCNFDNQTDIFTVCHSGLGSANYDNPIYIPLMGSSCGIGGSSDGVTIQGMTLNYNDGIFISNGSGVQLNNLNISGSHNGFLTFGCSFYQRWGDVEVTTTGRYGLIDTTGIFHIASMHLAPSSTVGAILGANITIDNLFVGPGGSKTVYPLIFRGNGAVTLGGITPNAVINWTSMDIESGMAALVSDVLFDQVYATLNGGDYECNLANSTCQPIAIFGQSGTPGLVLNNVGLSTSSTAASAVHVTGSPVNIFHNVQNKSGGSVPLTDGGTTIVCGGTGNGSVAGCTMPQIIAAGTACTNGELALSAGWGNTAAATAVHGTGQVCSWTITASGTGQAANPTITDTLTNPLPSANTDCWMIMQGGTQAFTSIQQTTFSATAPIFTFNGTPGAGNTILVKRGCGP